MPLINSSRHYKAAPHLSHQYTNFYEEIVRHHLLL
jgi:hypothetical protein